MGAGEEILLRLTRMEEKLDRVLAAKPAAGEAGGVASDYEMSGQHGDPKVKFLPRDWKGTDYKGCNFSAAEPAFLDMLAETLDYFAGKNKDEKKAGWDRLDAKRARGWAARLRSGWTAPRTEPAPDADPQGW